MSSFQDLPYLGTDRRDSGVSFSIPSSSCFFGHGSVSQVGLPDTFSDSESSVSPSGFSSSVSPASSLASSPALYPTHLPGSPVDSDDLCLSGAAAAEGSKRPSATQLAAYASSVIRNEAYALLALAARMAPAAHPILDEHFSSTFPGTAAMEKRTVESRTNISFRAVVDSLANLPAHGKVIVTGVGKSGIVGRKMVATFNSLGIQSVFMHPLEALHGDLGCVCACNPSHPCDALLLISHSGATAELMRLLPIVRSRVRTLIAVTRDPDSVLARSCNGWLDAGTGAYAGPSKGGRYKETDEADSDLPAPTSSVVSALAVGDALALSLSKLKLGWEKDGKARRQDFLRCHPGGQLGIELGRENRGVEPFTTASTS